MSEANSDGSEKPISPGMKIYTSKELFHGRKEIWIEHGEEMYRLRITARGNLYLTK